MASGQPDRILVRSLQMRHILVWTSRVLVWAVALMSGAFSLVREMAGLYGANTQPRTLFERLSIVAFIVSAAIAWGQERYSVVKLEKRVKGFPRLQVCDGGFYTDVRELTAPIIWLGERSEREVIGSLSSLNLRIQNDPVIPSQNAVATQVIANLAFFDSNRNRLFELDGRWGDTNQPTGRSITETKFDLLTVNIPIGATRELNIAFKYEDEPECYAINNESYDHEGFRNPRWRIDCTDVYAKVRIRGPNVDVAWLLSFKNLGEGKGLEAVDYRDCAPAMISLSDLRRPPWHVRARLLRRPL